MKSKPKAKAAPYHHVLNGVVSKECASPRKSLSTNDMLEKLRDELGQKDKELRETRKILDEIAERNKIFYRFTRFPLEIRHLIYSKFCLSDRVNGAKSCREMADYFMNKRLNVDVKMSLVAENDKVYVKILYRLKKYVEMYQIPHELVASVTRDLAASRNCLCYSFCDQNRHLFEKDVAAQSRFRYRQCSVANMSMVFETFALVDIAGMQVKTALVGGLVDLLQPTGMHPIPVPIEVTVHFEKDKVYKRNDPNFVVKNWEKWLDYLHPRWIKFETNTGMCFSPQHFMHKDLYDLPVIHNASYVYQTFGVDINFRQLMNMKAISIGLNETQSRYLTNVDVLEFYRVKMQAWIYAPKECLISIDSNETPHISPVADIDKLLKNVRQQLATPDFRVYPNYSPLSHMVAPKDAVTIRSMKFDYCLFMTEGMFWSQRCCPDEIWPENHGLRL